MGNFTFANTSTFCCQGLQPTQQTTADIATAKESSAAFTKRHISAAMRLLPAETGYLAGSGFEEFEDYYHF